MDPTASSSSPASPPGLNANGPDPLAFLGCILLLGFAAYFLLEILGNMLYSDADRLLPRQATQHPRVEGCNVHQLAEIRTTTNGSSDEQSSRVTDGANARGLGVNCTGLLLPVAGSPEGPPPDYMVHNGISTPPVALIAPSAHQESTATVAALLPAEPYSMSTIAMPVQPSPAYFHNNGQLILSNGQLRQSLEPHVLELHQRLHCVDAEWQQRQSKLSFVAKADNAAGGLSSDHVSGSGLPSPSASSSASSNAGLLSSTACSSSGNTPTPEPDTPTKASLGSDDSNCQDTGESETDYGGVSKYVWEAGQRRFLGRRFSGNNLRGFLMC